MLKDKDNLLHRPLAITKVAVRTSVLKPTSAVYALHQLLALLLLHPKKMATTQIIYIYTL